MEIKKVSYEDVETEFIDIKADLLDKHATYYGCYIKNELVGFKNIPNNLKALNCSLNKIVSLDNLNPELEILICVGNLIIELNNLPTKLINLDCSYNNICQLDFFVLPPFISPDFLVYNILLVDKIVLTSSSSVASYSCCKACEYLFCLGSF
jgi:hypothetical protein